MKKIIFIILSFVFISSCMYDDPECEPASIRCHGDVEQACNADSEWVSYADCSTIGQHCYSDAAHCSGYTDITCCSE